MTTPALPEGFDETKARLLLAKLRQEGRSDLAEEFATLLRSEGLESVIRNVLRGEEYESGRLGSRMARENVNEREAVEAEQLPFHNYVGASLGNALSSVPGGTALTAGIRSMGDQTYPEAYSDIEQSKQDLLTGPARLVGQLPGGVASTLMIPGGPIAQGTAYGGLLNFLDADPETTGGERLANTAIGAGIGGATSGVFDAVGRGVSAMGTAHSALAAPTAREALKAAKATRAEATRPLYEMAEFEGAMAQAMGDVSPELRGFLRQPDVRGIITDLRQMRQFRDLPDNDPRMLDAIYKELSDQSGRIGRVVEAPVAGRANTGKAQAQNLRLGRQEALDAFSGGPNAPMPTYAPAVSEYAAQSVPVEGVKRGYKAMRGGSSENTIEQRGSGALLDWLEQQAGDIPASEAAASGIRGFMRDQSRGRSAFDLMRDKNARRMLYQGDDLLREVENNPRSLLDLLRGTATTTATPQAPLPFGR